jgi:hypothetical protein
MTPKRQHEQLNQINDEQEGIDTPYAGKDGLQA